MQIQDHLRDHRLQRVAAIVDNAQEASLARTIAHRVLVLAVDKHTCRVCLWMGEDLRHRAHLNNAVVRDDCHTLADLLHHTHLVGDDHNRDPHFLVQPLEQRQD